MESKGIKPRFDFGFGLSYTTFEYSGLEISASGTGVTVATTIKNTGAVPGTEIPQLYLGFPANAGEPPKVLRGFEEVFLQPGSSSSITFNLNQRDLRSVPDSKQSSRVLTIPTAFGMCSLSHGFVRVAPSLSTSGAHTAISVFREPSDSHSFLYTLLVELPNNVYNCWMAFGGAALISYTDSTSTRLYRIHFLPSLSNSDHFPFSLSTEIGTGTACPSAFRSVHTRLDGVD